MRSFAEIWMTPSGTFLSPATLLPVPPVSARAATHATTNTMPANRFMVTPPAVEEAAREPWVWRPGPPGLLDNLDPVHLDEFRIDLAEAFPVQGHDRAPFEVRYLHLRVPRPVAMDGERAVLGAKHHVHGSGVQDPPLDANPLLVL